MRVPVAGLVDAAGRDEGPNGSDYAHLAFGVLTSGKSETSISSALWTRRAYRTNSHATDPKIRIKLQWTEELPVRSDQRLQ
mmetsp:Transcript_61461/g.181647  ORF Transcript_61461/g.181647 Transcript_61461/m.181647 type:complete len:81 (+) Transcript_61461:212-454(+)